MLPTLHAISLSLHPRLLVVTALSSILAERLLGEGMRYEKKDRSANGVHTMARGYSPVRYLKLEQPVLNPCPSHDCPSLHFRRQRRVLGSLAAKKLDGDGSTYRSPGHLTPITSLSLGDEDIFNPLTTSERGLPRYHGPCQS